MLCCEMMPVQCMAHHLVQNELFIVNGMLARMEMGVEQIDSRWRHQMKIFPCNWNPPVTGEFPTKRPVRRSLDVFFDLRLNKRLSKQSWCWWFETPYRPLWRHCKVIDKQTDVWTSERTESITVLTRGKYAENHGANLLGSPLLHKQRLEYFILVKFWCASQWICRSSVYAAVIAACMLHVNGQWNANDGAV